MSDSKLRNTLDDATRRRLTEREGLTQDVNDVADQIQAGSILGTFDFQVSTEAAEHTVQKLVMAVNFLLDATRRAVAEGHRQRARLSTIQEELRVTVERQAAAIEVLSTPILELWDNVLALPVIGALDQARASEMMVQLLDAVVAQQASHVLLDLTGVDMIDSHTADHLLRLVRAVELLGAKALITGIRPAVAQSITQSGLDLGRVRTFRSLQEGLRRAMTDRRRDDARALERRK
ncbi:MAG: STAS domain-containing protein [Nannocystaceae bacterium]